jgi:uncharacterized membrane protein YidH (DUF202 family)
MNPFIHVKTPALASDEVISTTRPFSLRRVRTGLGLTLAGFLIFMIGARPDFFGLDRSPIIGFVQIAVFLIGLAIMCLGGYLSMMAPWRNQAPSIAMDFGVRLVSTGYVIAVFAGMADVFGFGSHAFPDIPFFGPWQARGVLIGQIFIIFGFLLLIPFPVRKANSNKKKSRI